MLALCFAGFLFGTDDSFAETPVTGKKILPETDIEYYELTSPTDVMLWDDKIAVSENPKTVTVFCGNKKSTVTIPDTTATTVGQLGHLSDDYLLVLSNNKIYKISLDDYSISYLCDDEGSFITCTYYTTSDEYLITSSGDTGSASIYRIIDGVPKYLNFSITGISGNKPIALSGDNLIFVKNEKVYSRPLTGGIDAEEVLLINANPDNIVCQDGFLFYNVSSAIHRFNIQTLTDETLTLSNKYEENDKFQLGNIGAISDMLVVGDKLYLTDNVEKTICEYKIENTLLSFTGYAICKGKTAYNRIGNAKDIERRGDLIAVLDEYKLTVINTEYSDCYEPQRFTNLLVGNVPNCFSLGTDSVLYVTSENQAKLRRLSGKDAKKTFDVTASGKIIDVVYKCGKYYLLSVEGLTTTVFTVTESDLTTTRKDYVNHLFDSLEVDVAGSIYMGDGINLYKDDIAICAIEAGVKLVTDFSNNVFKCIDGKIYSLNASGTWKEENLAEQNITSFSLDFDLKNVLYTVSNEHYIYYTDELDNVSIESTVLPVEYKISGVTADVTTVKTAELENRAIIFGVKNEDGYFKFDGYMEKEDNYIYVCDLVLSQTEKYACLSSENGLSLVRYNFVNESATSVNTESGTAYVTTSVHAYYLPLITLDGRHQIDKGATKLKLEKHSLVNVIGKITVFGKEFYLISTDGQNVGYLPIDFTTKVLTQLKTLNDFTSRKVESTDVYSDKEMTQTLLSLKDDDTVKLYSVDGNVATVLIESGDEYIFGYIDAEKIIDEASTTVRNLLIAIVVLTCVVVSVSFFVLKRKNEN